ncbi:hypothetical protein D043_0457A, partial [Vibrio parahaemolyticus EKP-021]
MTYPL